MQLFWAKFISISQKIAQKNRTFQSDESDESDQSDFPDKALEKSKNHRFYPIFSDLCRIFISLTVVDKFLVFVVLAGRVGNKKTVTDLSQARHRKVDILDN